MLIKACEVEFSRDEEQDRTHGFEASVSACFAFGGLKQAVDSLDEAVGLARLSPGNNAVEVSANQSRDVLHRFDLRAHDVSCTRLSRALLNLPRGTQLRSIGKNRLKKSSLKASAVQLNGTTLRQLFDNALIRNGFSISRAPEFAYGTTLSQFPGQLCVV
jgi:hypothetical protein